MPDELLPEEFDIVVYGTGMPESIVAAAYARSGLRVLHIDRHDLYGSFWTSYSLEQLSSFVHERSSNGVSEAESEEQQAVQLGDNERLVKLQTDEQIFQLEERWYEHSGEADQQLASSESDVAQSGAESTVQQTASNRETKQSLLSKSRHFQIDMCPKLLFADGAMIHLLVSSNVAQYAEFVAVDKLFAFSESETQEASQLECIPCTRSELFNTRRLTLAEKRLMTNLVTFCTQLNAASCEETAKWSSFGALVRDRFKLTEKLTRYVATISALMRNGIIPSQSAQNQDDWTARFLDDVSVADGVEAMRRFLASLGRYGNATPFLVTRYGTNEIVQGFTRFAAVFGGIYCLRRWIKSLVLQKLNDNEAAEQCVAVVLDNGQRVKVQSALLSAECVAESDLCAGPCRALLRSVFVAERSAFPEAVASGNERSRNLLVLPVPANESGEGGCVALVLELDATSGCVPRGLLLVHMLSVRTYADCRTMLRDAPLALHKTVDYVSRTLFSESDQPQSGKPTLLYRCSFIVKDCVKVGRFEHDSSRRFAFLQNVANVFTISGHDATDPDCSRAVSEAKLLFQTTIEQFPDASHDFLPRAPDPEDIVIDGEHEQPADSNGSAPPVDQQPPAEQPQT